jgi:hypothetical protein
MVRFPNESERFSPLSRPFQLWDLHSFLLNLYVEVFLARELSRQSVSLTIELHLLPRLGVCTLLHQPLSLPLLRGVLAQEPP